MVEMLMRIDQFGRISWNNINRKPVKEFVSPMKEINIVINSSFVRDTAERGNEEAKQILKLIEGWKDPSEPDRTFREVDISGWTATHSKNLLEDLNLDIPKPARDLQINVCGVNTDMSNIIFLLALRESGYNAKFNHRASCAGRTEPPQTVIHDILDQFPDFFD